MSEITREQMVEWLKEQKKDWKQRLIGLPRGNLFKLSRNTVHDTLDMFDSILAALTEGTGGPSGEDQKEMLKWVNQTCRTCSEYCGVPEGQDHCLNHFCLQGYQKIRKLILGNQGGTVSPDTQVSPHGETSGAVTDKWERDRLWCSALVHVLSVEDIAKVTGYFNSIRPDREAGAAGKEKDDDAKR